MAVHETRTMAQRVAETDRESGPAYTAGTAGFRDRYLWVGFAVLAGLGFIAIWEFLPHEREGVSLWQFILKIGAMVLAIAAVGTFPQKMRAGWLIASLPFAVFLGFVIPRMTMLFLTGPKTQPEYYTYLWSLLYPGIVLSLCLAFRLGGGSSGRTIKIGLNGLVLVFSGYLELMWFVVNPTWNYYDMGTIPHVQVIIGHFPSYGGLLIFALCHIPVLAAVNLAPIDRWLDRLRGVQPSPVGSL